MSISEGRNQPLIDQATFYQQLVKSFKPRIESVDEKHILTQSTQGFEPYSWPRNEQNEIQISQEFSENLLKGLCNFLLDDFALTKQEFREFKGHFNGEEHVSASCDNIFRTLEQLRLPRLKRLYSSSMIIPVSNSEWERGFSIMNIICTDVRSILPVKHLSSLMFIRIEGPPTKRIPAK